MVTDGYYDGTSTSNNWHTFADNCTSATIEYDSWGTKTIKAKYDWRLVDTDATASAYDSWTSDVKYKILSAATSATNSLFEEYVAYGRDCSYTYKKVHWDDCAPHRSPQDRLREILQNRQAPMILGTRKGMSVPQDPREIRARETLRRVLGEDKFRRFIKHGFVSVQAKSGLVYQIFPGHGITNVYRNGEKVERLCVVLSGDFPPTDSIIMRYLLILNDEADFRKQAIQHHVSRSTPERLVTEPESLNDVWRRLKVA